MSYEASTMSNNMRSAYSTDVTPMYTAIPRPTTSPAPSLSPAPTYSNPNGGTGGSSHAGETDSMAMVTAGVDGSGGVTVKRKRGRPRKYSPDASVSPAAMMPPGQAGPEASEFSSPALTSGKKPRGRPPGSLNKQHPATSGSPGVGFMPHILDVKAGEDVVAKMMWFSQNSTRALCVLSANGAVSNVTLRQSPAAGGTVTYETTPGVASYGVEYLVEVSAAEAEALTAALAAAKALKSNGEVEFEWLIAWHNGNFEILTLSGSFMVSEVGGQRLRTGGLSVALSGPDGRVLGGNVAGLLTAASPVQVIVGSFVPASQKQTKTGAAVNNKAEAPHSESSGGGLGSPFDLSNTNSNPQAMANMTWR